MQRHLPFGLKKKEDVISILILRHQSRSRTPITKNIFHRLSYVTVPFHASRATKTMNLFPVCLSRERCEVSYILALLRRPLEPLSDSLITMWNWEAKCSPTNHTYLEPCVEDVSTMRALRASRRLALAYATWKYRSQSPPRELHKHEIKKKKLKRTQKFYMESIGRWVYLIIVWLEVLKLTFNELQIMYNQTKLKQKLSIMWATKRN